MILPLILKTDESRDKFGSFLKIAYNESKKNRNATSKKFVGLLKNTVKTLTKRGLEGDSACSEFITKFYLDDVVAGGLKALQISQSKDVGKKEPVVQNVYYSQEELAVKYACPSLFNFMTKLFMKDYKSLFSHNYAVISDVLTLALGNAFQLASFSTTLKERFTLLALEIVYYTHDNIKSLDLKSIENVVNNRLALHVGQLLKNDKKNEKNQETQRLLTEMYISLLSLRTKSEELKQKQIE